MISLLECCGREVRRLQGRLFNATVTKAPETQLAKLRTQVDRAESDQLKLASKAGCWLLQASQGLGQELDALEDGTHITMHARTHTHTHTHTHI
jgi:hypothetical protein